MYFFLGGGVREALLARISVYLEPREHVWWLQMYPISVKRNRKIEANVVVSECTVCHCV